MTLEHVGRHVEGSPTDINFERHAVAEVAVLLVLVPVAMLIALASACRTIIARVRA